MEELKTNVVEDDKVEDRKVVANLILYIDNKYKKKGHRRRDIWKKCAKIGFETTCNMPK